MRALRRIKFISFSISFVLITVMLWVYGGIRVHAENYVTYSKRPVSLAAPPSRFDELLSEIKDVVKQSSSKTKSAPEKGFDNIEKLTALKDGLEGEHEKSQDYFDSLESAIKKKELPDEILKRHQEFVEQYESKYETLMEHLESIESARTQTGGFWARLIGAKKKPDWDGIISKTLAFLEKNTPSAPQSHFDPKNMPHRSLKADKPIPPKLTREEWSKAFPKESVGTTPAPAKKSGPTTLAATLQPVLADLEETIEVKFTPEIRELADSLDKNPVKIFNWVRNNIEFVPTWGSIQGAQLCLETRAGNAFDTASLLIALLRYSGIPARYQMGTIEVPVEKFKNWAGGFTNAEAAASLFASAGVPSVVRRVNQNGQVVTVRLEHVWVKALVDYAPSAGAVHRQSETWIEMDGSFKQYSFSNGLDFEAAVPSGIQPFVAELARNATIDDAGGSVTGLNSAAVMSFIQQNVDQRINYLRTNFSNATGREIFGGKTIVAHSLMLLPANSPYKVLARANEMAQVPNDLRHRITFGLGANQQMPDSAGLFSYTASLPELAGKNILLLYVPASQADEQLLLQSQSSFPAYINLTPQLYVGDQLTATGQPLRVGSAVISQITFSSPTISTPAILNTMVAGESAAIGLDLQGISQSRLEDLRQKTQDARDRLQQGTFQSLNNRDYAEVFLSNNIAHWFSMVDASNKATAKGAGVVTIRYPSAGLFFLKQEPSSLFGSVVSVLPTGLGMDIDRDIVVSVAKDGDAEKAVNLSLTQGILGSANEAEMPIRLMSTPAQPFSGTATIQALQMANDQGVPIYRINASNAATIIPLLQVDSNDLVDIQDAVNAGLEVTVSRTTVNFNGRNVLGMMISDPLSGSASFLISGGTNGAIIFGSIFATTAMAVFFWAGAIVFPALGPILFLLIAGMLIASVILATLYTTLGDNGDYSFLDFTPCALAATILAGIAAIAAIATATVVEILAFSLSITKTAAEGIVKIVRAIATLGSVLGIGSRC